jgi:hypothetical protein
VLDDGAHNCRYPRKEISSLRQTERSAPRWTSEEMIHFNLLACILAYLLVGKQVRQH